MLRKTESKKLMPKWKKLKNKPNRLINFYKRKKMKLSKIKWITRHLNKNSKRKRNKENLLMQKDIKNLKRKKILKNKSKERKIKLLPWKNK